MEKLLWNKSFNFQSMTIFSLWVEDKNLNSPSNRGCSNVIKAKYISFKLNQRLHEGWRLSTEKDKKILLETKKCHIERNFELQYNYNL